MTTINHQPSIINHMHHALRLAAQGLGQVWPNPAVGCVIVNNGQVVGLGRTQKGGRPHAETQALTMAGEAARGATVYVTLEPCAHHGRTPPCAEALIAAGVAEVVVACGDPDNRVNGAGVRVIREAGIRVIEGICEAEAKALNCGFFSRIQRKRPWVTLKIASSADGFITPLLLGEVGEAHAETGEGASTARNPSPESCSASFDLSQRERRNIVWITCPVSLAHVHQLRSRNDAILTGIGTVLADDPQLTCRLPGLEDRSPQRIVLDRQQKMPFGAKMLHDGKGEIWILDSRFPTLDSILTHLADQGITRLMVEAGHHINSSFIQEELIDEIYWYRAPKIFGSGLPAFAGSLDLTNKIKFFQRVGVDTLTLYSLTPNP